MEEELQKETLKDAGIVRIRESKELKRTTSARKYLTSGSKWTD